jgi:predicted nucleic acid-binding protein
MSVFVDTSVWSLALRRSPRSRVPEVEFLESYLKQGDLVVTTGIVLQELLQGFQGPKAKRAIIKDFSLLPVITPDIEDHVEAAELRNRCRRKGVQIGTIDALIARLCIRHELPLLTTDQDFKAVSRHCPLSLVKGSYPARRE